MSVGITARLERNKHPEIMNELATFLMEKGHECVMIVGLKDHKFTWCEKDNCEMTSVWKDANEIEPFASSLRSKGHECLVLMECYPPRYDWCQKDVCVKALV
jgi:hypothetical protein